MSKIKFTKMSGTLNDFIIIDNRSKTLDADHLSDWVQKICTRKYSIGADGLILIEKSDKADFKWRFFNCDGSEAEMCGNGSRCAARFSYLEGITDQNLTFETQAGIIKAQVNGNLVKVQMTDPSQMKLDSNLTIEGSTVHFSKINTGVPHAVIKVDNLEDFTLQTLLNLGRTIRMHKYFEPKGTNVNFIEVVDDSHVKVKTYERGVEDITYACGTGVVASALIAHAKKLAQSPIEIETPGGKLMVYFEFDGKNYANVFLEGDARVVYRGEMTDESV